MASGRHARSRPRRRRRAGSVAGVVLGAAGSTLTTVATATVVGYQADRVLQPIEFTLRVVVLLLAPCVGAAAANWLLSALAGRHMEPPPAWAVGIGAVAGPVLALRLDRVIDYGYGPTAVTVAVMGAWAVIAAALTSTITRRSAGVDHTALPQPTTLPPDDLPPTSRPPGNLPPGGPPPSDRPPTTPGDDAPTNH
jgi:hypothetical protein